ncbi:MAG: secretion system X translation initiation factor [Gammaproteobacteria bacterium]|nr:secretion system X translation initiation factor [Gammaproteobacteria bacterium]MBV9621201.1 secretion system X translation initiation factor [Gammaproteobacteria bacterium]
MAVTTRTRLLIGTAAGIGVYIAVGPRDPQPIEAAKAHVLATRVEPHAAAALAPSGGGLLYRLAHRVTEQSGAGALFAAHSWYVAPPPPPPAPVQAAPVAPPAPTAPPLPFQYMGSYVPDGGAAVFFLTRADRVYDVHVGDTIDNTYSVDSYNGTQLVLTYKPLNIQQQLTAGGAK